MAFQGIEFNAGQFKKRMKDEEKASLKAMVSTLNKVAKTVTTHASRAIAEDWNIKKGDIQKQIVIKKATPRTQQSIVKAKGKRIPLIKFKASQTATGVRVKVRRSGSAAEIKHAFITAPGGNKSVFARRTIGGKRAARLPIDVLKGPSVPFLLGSKKVMGTIKSIIPGEMTKVYTREHKFFRSKIK